MKFRPALIFLVAAGYLHSAMAVDTMLLGEWPGYIRGNPRAVAVRGSAAYVAIGDGGLLVLDIQNPRDVRVLGSIPLPSATYDIQLKDNFAFVTALDAGLHIVDITDSSRPVRVAGYGTNETVRSFYSVGELAVVMTETNGVTNLKILNIRDPVTPQLLGSYPTTGNAIISGDHVILAHGGSATESPTIEIVDISKPSQPVSLSLSEVRGPPVGLAVNSNLLLVALGKDYRYPSAPDGGLQIIDITNPTTPLSLGGYVMSGANGGATHVAYRDGFAYLAGPFGVQVLDVRDPRKPSLVSNDGVTGPSLAVTLAGNLAFSCGRSSLEIVDVTKPNHLVRVGVFQTTGMANDVAIAGNLAFVSDFDAGLRIIDVSDRSQPREIGRYPTQGYYYAVAVTNNLAVLSGNVFNNLQILNTDNVVKPVLVSSNSIPAAHVAIQGNLLYTCARESGLIILNIANPSQPITLSQFNTTGYPTAVAASGNYVYVCFEGPNFSGGFDILDVTNPNSPVRVGSYNTVVPSTGLSSLAYGIAVSGGLVLLACSEAGLQFVDITTPIKPRLIQTYYLDGKPAPRVYILKVAVSGNLACITANDRGVHILDISNPERPFKLASYNARPSDASPPSITGYALNVAMNDSTVFVANGDYGLRLLDLNNLATPILDIMESPDQHFVQLGGYPGREYQLQRASTISTVTEWTQLASITLTNNLQLIPVPFSTNDSHLFIRAVLNR
jgi:hypothetical protein